MTIAEVHTPLQAPVEVRFSALLRTVAEGHSGDRVSIGELIGHFGARGHGALMIVLGLPNVLPLPLPGLSLIAGVPLMFLAVQLTFGQGAPWFPARLRKRSVSATDYRRISAAIVPRMVWLERFVRPRWSALTRGLPRRFLGLYCIILAAALLLPLPFGNGLPGLAIALIGLALIERDGAIAMTGVLVGFAGIAVTTAASAALAGGFYVFAHEIVGGLLGG